MIRSRCLLCLAAAAAPLVGCAELPPEGAAPIDPYTVACDVDEGGFALALDGSQWPMILDWGDRDIWAVAVTSPGAEIGRMGRLEFGDVHWMVAASLFGGRLDGPLVYGEVPAAATDYTTFSGGTFAEALDPDACYEIQLSDPSHRDFGRLQFRLNAL